MTTTTTTKTTFWLWPPSLFPRRLVYYLRAKRLSLDALSASNIHLIPIHLDSNGDIVSKPGYEARPAGTSLPCLRIEKPDAAPFFIYESAAIMEYFEEIFSAGDGYEDLRGQTPPQRARTRDILSLLADAILLHGQHLIHSDESTLSWSGLRREQWSADTAADTKKRRLYLLSRLERWVSDDIVKKGTKSLSGEGMAVSLADIVLMAMVQYNETSYDLDFVAEHGALKVWYEKMKGAEWFLDQKGMERLEADGLKTLFE